MDDFEEVAVVANQLAKYWESQWLIGYYSDTESNKWYHDRAVAERRADRGA